MREGVQHCNVDALIFSFLHDLKKRNVATDTLPTPIQVGISEYRVTKATRSHDYCHRQHRRQHAKTPTGKSPPLFPLLPIHACLSCLRSPEEGEGECNAFRSGNQPGAHPSLVSLSLSLLYPRPRLALTAASFSSAARLGRNIIADWNCHRRAPPNGAHPQPSSLPLPSFLPSFAAGQNHSLIFGFNSHVNISLSPSMSVRTSLPRHGRPNAPNSVARSHRGSELAVARQC